MTLRPRLAFLCSVACAIVFASSARAEDAAALPAPIRLEPVVRGVDHPTFVTNDGTPDGRLYVVQQPGQIMLIDHGKLQREPWLDLSDHVTYGGECGLLSVAFHPDFANHPLIYVDYTTGRGSSLHTVIAEFKVAGGPAATRVDAGTERSLLEIHQPQSNHNGGQLLFGPEDGDLYIGMGDGGAANDRAAGHEEPTGNGQSRTALLGKILRIDVDHPSSGKAYGIPQDNPFANDSAYSPEIFAMGLRNPWRFSFDRATHLIYCGDVGQDKYEEIDIITKGGNYGWRIREGTHPFNVPKQMRADLQLVEPIKDYTHAEGISITGGYVYRGKAVPDLQGWYVYADYGKGWIGVLKYEDGKVVAERTRFFRRNVQISSFGEDYDGELYVCDHGNGAILRVAAAEGASAGATTRR